MTEDYLGPAGERFIRRQITAHLDIQPEKLDRKNLSKLIDWLSIAFAMLTSNTTDVESFKRDLKRLCAGK